MSNHAMIIAEGKARGFSGQRLNDFVDGWYLNAKHGTGRRHTKYRKINDQSLKAV